MKRFNNERGGVMLSALIFGFILILIAAAVVNVTVVESRIVAKQINSTKAFYVAEAGIERAIALYRDNINATPTLSGSIGEGTYADTAATTTSYDVYGTPSEFLIQIAGTVGDRTRTIEIVLDVVNPFTDYADLRDSDANYSHDGDNQYNVSVGPRHMNGNLTFSHGDNKMIYLGDVEATGSISNISGGSVDYSWNGTEGGKDCISSTGELITGLDDDHTQGQYYGYQIDWDGNVMVQGSSSPAKNIAIHGEVKPNAPYVEIPTSLDLDSIAAGADYTYGSTVYLRMVRDPASASGSDPSALDASDSYKVYVFHSSGDQSFNPNNPSAGSIDVIDMTGADDAKIIYADGDIHIKGEEMTSDSSATYNRATLDGRLTVVAEDDVEIDGEIVYAGDTLPAVNSPVTEYDNVEGDDSIALLAKDEMHINTAGSGWSDPDDGFPTNRASIIYGVRYSENKEASTSGRSLSNGGARRIGCTVIKNNAGSTFYHFKGAQGRESSYDWRFKYDSSVIPPGLQPTVALKSWTEKALTT